MTLKEELRLFKKGMRNFTDEEKIKKVEEYLKMHKLNQIGEKAIVKRLYKIFEVKWTPLPTKVGSFEKTKENGKNKKFTTEDRKVC